MTDTLRNCIVCGIDISDKREDAKTCSPKCRNIASREAVTHNVAVTHNDTLSDIEFKFVTLTKIRKTAEGNIPGTKSKVRTAKYWYNVPLGAVPIVQKGWPEVPKYMNGRQYFLWWKNEFKTNDKGEAVIHNPFPSTEAAVYVSAGEQSRRWGA